MRHERDLRTGAAALGKKVLKQPRRFAPALMLVAVAGWIVTSGVSGLRRLGDVQARYDRMAAEVETLEAERARLREAVRRLEEDPAALELLARSSQYLSAPGEIVVLLPH